MLAQPQRQGGADPAAAEPSQPHHRSAGGLHSWQQAGLSVRRLANAPLLLLGLILSNLVAPTWILLTWFVATGSTQQLRPFPITSRHIPSRS